MCIAGVPGGGGDDESQLEFTGGLRRCGEELYGSCASSERVARGWGRRGQRWGCGLAACASLGGCPGARTPRPSDASI